MPAARKTLEFLHLIFLFYNEWKIFSFFQTIEKRWSWSNTSIIDVLQIATTQSSCQKIVDPGV